MNTIAKRFVIVSLIVVANISGVGENACAQVDAWDRGRFQPAVIVSPSHAVQLDIHYLYRRGEHAEVKPLTNGSILSTGDVYSIIFTPVTTCTVYIFEVDSADQIKQLFPVSDFEGTEQKLYNPVEGGKTYVIPIKGKTYQIVPLSPLKEIYVLAFPQPNEEIEELSRKILEAQRQNDDRKLGNYQARLLKTIQSQKISHVEPLVNLALLEKQKYDPPVTPTLIKDVLGLPLPESQRFGPKGTPKGLGIQPPDTLLEQHPKVILLGLFADHSAEILPESQPVLHEYGQVLQKELREIDLLIAAHTDRSEPEAMELTRRRAEAIKQFFVAQFQIAEQRLQIQSYGSNFPAVAETSPESRKINNRIELIRLK